MDWIVSFFRQLRGIRSESELVALNNELIAHFNRFVAINLGWATRHIPDNALIVAQIEGDEEFNEWAQSLAYKHFEIGQAIFPVEFRQVKTDGTDIELHPDMFRHRSRAITGDLAF